MEIMMETLCLGSQCLSNMSLSIMSSVEKGVDSIDFPLHTHLMHSLHQTLYVQKRMMTATRGISLSLILA